MNIMGIDPGFSGAIAVIDGNSNKILSLHDMPTLKGDKNYLNINALKDILNEHKIDYAYLEHAQAMPKQGVVGMFRYGEVFGVIQGILHALRVPYELVKPQVWKKAIMSGMEKSKDSSIWKAEQLFPEFICKRKKDHGKAEALLIAWYGKVNHCL